MEAAVVADEAALVVDKVAAAVARNGPAFEALLREKQQGNPKYAFLYGGAYADRYALALQRERTGRARLLAVQRPSGCADMARYMVRCAAY